MKRLIAIYLIFQITGGLFGQNRGLSLSIDQDTITIGESVNVTLQIDQVPDDQNQTITLDLSKIENLAYAQDTNFFEQYGDIEFIDNDLNQFTNENKVIIIPINNVISDAKPWRYNIKLGVYSVGVFYINNPYFGSEVDTLKNKLGNYLFVMPPADFGQDSTKLINNIKPIIEVETNWKDYLNLIYAGLIILLVIIIIYYIRKHLRKPKLIKEEDVEQPPIEKVVIPAHITALAALKKLQDEKIWLDGKVKEYQSQLTNTIRKYLEGRYDIRAMELTTSEIATQLNKQGFAQDQLKTLKEILTVADLVKFAKAHPSEDIHQKFLDSAFEFVNNTKLITNAE